MDRNGKCDIKGYSDCLCDEHVFAEYYSINSHRIVFFLYPKTSMTTQNILEEEQIQVSPKQYGDHFSSSGILLVSKAKTYVFLLHYISFCHCGYL